MILTPILAEQTLSPWVAGGLAVVAAVAFATKQFVPGWMYQDIKEENKEIKAENRRLTQLVIDTQAKNIPALEEASKMVSQATTVVQDAVVELRIIRQGQQERRS